MRVAHTDAQLALVLGHELAHANLGHLDKRLANQILGWAGGAAIDASLVLDGIWTGGVFDQQVARASASAFSVLEADYIGAYFAARAGYDLAGPKSGGRSRWRTPTRFGSGERTRQRPCVSYRCRLSPRLPTNSAVTRHRSPEFNAPRAEANPTDDSQ